MLLKKLARETALYGGGDLAGKVIAFFTFPIIAAALLPKTFGALDLIMTTIGLAGLLMNCGINNAVQLYYWDASVPAAQRPLMISSGLYLQLALGVGLALIGLLSLPLILPQVHRADLPLTKIALIAALLLMIVTQVTQYIQDVTRLHMAPVKFLILSLLSRILTAALSVFAVLWLKMGIDGLLSVQVATGLLVIPLGLYMVRADIVPAFDRQWARNLFKYGHPFIFVGLAYWLFGSMDRWILSFMSSVAETGIYSVAYRFASIVLFVSAAFGQAWSPYAIKTRADYPDHYRRIYGQIFLILLYSMLIIGGGIALFSGEIIGVLMPASYAPAAIPLAILCFGIVCQSTTQITAIGISLEKKTYVFSRLAWLTAAINFAGNILLVPRYGATGSAWATCFSYLVLTCGYMLYSQRLHPIAIAWGRLSVLLALGGSVLVVSLMLNSVTFHWRLVAVKLVFAAACVVVGWFMLPVGKFADAVEA